MHVAPVIAAIGPVYCSDGAEVRGILVVRTEKWAPRAPEGEGYSGINLRAGMVIDGISLETTDGEALFVCFWDPATPASGRSNGQHLPASAAH